MGKYLGVIAILLLWGLWSFLPKVTVNLIPARQAMFFHALGGFLVGLATLYGAGSIREVNWQGALLAVITGAVGVGGSVLFYRMIQHETASFTAVVTSLYPIVSVALAILFLNESLTMKQGIASLLAMASLALFAL
jgi:transporter family protein